ncbi:hypothetical protein [Faecalibaculum rodentium]|uniref:hypothetical protein n=1 Tax=Faecalibaculum rodentium TaxID=1702221 RepID=UPI00261C4044|nr:hypothetical protein [Faecalibaculum rodentium]
MTKAELRKLIRSMPKEQLEEALLELHGRQDKTKKEVFELILKGISENRTLPDKKASIPDTRSMRKKLETIRDRIQGWYYYRRRSARTRARRDLKTMISQLLLCPSQSIVYPEACSLLEDLFDLSVTYLHTDLFPGTSIESVYHLSTDELFRTIAGFILKSGYTRDNLKRLSSLSCIVESSDWALSMHLQEILVSILKNGDIRIEMMDILEDRIQAGLEFGQAGLLLDRLCILYLLICEQETSLENGTAWIREATDDKKALSLLNLFQRCRTVVRERQQEYFREEEERH